MWESKVAPLSGAVFAVLLAVATVTIGNYEFMPAEGEVASFYSGDSARIMTGAYIGLLSCFFLLWFAASVGRSLRAASARLAGLALGGGVVASVMISFGFLATTAGAERALLHGIDASAAAVLHDLSSMAVGTGASYGFAALIGAFAIVGLRDRIWPKWLSITSLVVAIGLVSPINWLVIGVAVIWTVVAGVLIYRRPTGVAVVSDLEVTPTG